MVLELEDVVQDKARKLCSLARKTFSEGRSLDLMHGFRAVSIDVVTDYAFADCYDLLDKEDIGKQFFQIIQERGRAIRVFVQWPGVRSVATSLPKSLVAALSPPLALTFHMIEVYISHLLLMSHLLTEHSIVANNVNPSKMLWMQAHSQQLLDQQSFDNFLIQKKKIMNMSRIQLIS